MSLDQMSEKKSRVKAGKHDWDEEYRTGAHWDTIEPSSNIPSFMEIVKGKREILDAGCGSGRDAIFLAKQGFNVTGIDISPEGIKLAKRRSKGESNLNFVVGAIEKLPFANSQFDAIYSGYTLSDPTLPQESDELARVLKSGGILYVAMFTKTAYETPNDRDESNPQDFVLENFRRHFEIKNKSAKIYTEEDDQGKHEHELLTIELVKK